MYPRRAQGWHQVSDSNYHHSWDVQQVPVQRGHFPGQYGEAFNTHREQGSYNSGVYHNRMYIENQCPENNQSYEYEEGGYYMGGHYDRGYHKRPYHRHVRGDATHYGSKKSESYHKKHASKPFKNFNKERESQGETCTPTAKPPLTVVHNPARTMVVLTSGENSGDEASKETVTPQQVDAKKSAIHQSETNRDSAPYKRKAHESEMPLESTKMSAEPEPNIKTKVTTETTMDGWTDISSCSPETPPASELEPACTGRRSSVPDTTQALRTAFILARKEEIELAYAQDCRTFALVASMLLKKDPSMEAAVARALRSSLQEIAGRCVLELRSFIDRYDMESGEPLLL